MAFLTARPGCQALAAACALMMSAPAAEAQQRRQTPARATDVAVLHRGDLPMRNLHVTPVGEPAWGPDRLGGRTLAIGERRQLRLDTGWQCRYDLRAVYDGGREETRFGVDLCRQPEVAFDGRTETSAEDLRRQGPVGLFVARNRTGRAMMTLTLRWYYPNGYDGEDLLGAAPLAAGATITARFPRGKGCIYDLIAGVETEGPPRLLERVNLCTRREVVFEPRQRGTAPGPARSGGARE